jgi:hypothetical protein
VDITLRYFDGCPNWRTARERLREALGESDRPDQQVELEQVATPEEAELLRFRGSPTILIDGEDPFVDGAAPFGLSCRVYRTERGLEGSPSVEQLRQALAGRGLSSSP